MSGPAIPYTRAALAAGLRALGVQPGHTLMLHASVKALGPLMGGPNVIIQALQDVVTPSGTLMMYAGWEDIPDYLDEIPASQHAVYYDQHPPFDPATARAVRENSILAEFLRTWPGAQRSRNPEASMVAVGAQAAYLTADHPLNYGYGAGSPLEKLVQMGGKVLLLGSPLDNITLLHYAEFRARMRHKQVIHYPCPLWIDGETVWVEIEDFETGEEHDDYTFAQIAQDYLDRYAIQPGMVGSARCTLLDAAGLAQFAIAWLEERFGE